MNGVMPITISATLAVSPNPKTMNRIGSSAMGGITAMVVTSAPSVARAAGSTPNTMPTSNADSVQIPSPNPSRSRLAAVSAQKITWPLRGSASSSSPRIAATIAAGVGSTLSDALAACRAAEANR